MAFRWAAILLAGFFSLAGLSYWAGLNLFDEVGRDSDNPILIAIVFLGCAGAALASSLLLWNLEGTNRSTPTVVSIAIAAVAVSILALSGETAISNTEIDNLVVGITETAVMDLRKAGEDSLDSRVLRSTLAASDSTSVFTSDGFIRRVPDGVSIFDPDYSITDGEFVRVFPNDEIDQWDPDAPDTAAEHLLGIRLIPPQATAENFARFPSVDPVVSITRVSEQVRETSELRGDSRLFASMAIDEGQFIEATVSDRPGETKRQ